MADIRFTPKELEKGLADGSLTEDDLKFMHPADQRVFLGLLNKRSDLPPTLTERGTDLAKAAFGNKTLMKTGGMMAGAAGTALLPEVGLPLWALEMLGGAAGSVGGSKAAEYFGGAEPTSTAVDAAEGALGPSMGRALGAPLQVVGKTFNSMPPMARTGLGSVIGASIAQSTGHSPWYGAIAGGGVGRTSPAITAFGDYLASQSPAQWTRRLMGNVKPFEAGDMEPVSEAGLKTLRGITGDDAGEVIRQGSTTRLPKLRNAPADMPSGSPEAWRADIKPGGAVTDSAGNPLSAAESAPTSSGFSADEIANLKKQGFSDSLIEKVGKSSGNGNGAGASVKLRTPGAAEPAVDPASAPPTADSHLKNPVNTPYDDANAAMRAEAPSKANPFTERTDVERNIGRQELDRRVTEGRAPNGMAERRMDRLGKTPPPETPVATSALRKASPTAFQDSEKSIEEWMAQFEREQGNPKAIADFKQQLLDSLKAAKKAKR